MKKRRMWICLWIASSWCLGGPAADAEETIGEWVGHLGSLEQKFAIFESNGVLYWKQGGTVRNRLKEVSPTGREQRRFEELDSCCQQVFAINHDGDLVLYDEDGLVLTAERKGASQDHVPPPQRAPQRSVGTLRQVGEKLQGQCRVGGVQFDVDADEISLHVKDCKTLALMVARVRARGYRCDSVNQVLPFFFGGGLTLWCNSSRYKYEFEDHGGRVIMKVVD